MKQTWRWFGPQDRVSIDDIRQAGAAGVVSALHHVATGAVWTPEAIAARQAEIAVMRDGSPSTLDWTVVESLPVSEDIKSQTGAWRDHVDAWRASLRNLSAAGIGSICYNFMPVLDWTRTDLAWRLASACDLHALRPDRFRRLRHAHPCPSRRRRRLSDEALREAAGRRFAEMSAAARDRLARNVVFGLPGAAEHFTLDDVRAHLAAYAGTDADRLRANLIDFLGAVVPLAEDLGVRLCCHPDDPPFPLLGLPRVMSTEADYRDGPGRGGQPGQRHHALLGLARRTARQ